MTAGGSKSAVLNDSPMLKVGESKQFETAAIIVETGHLLGSLSWIIQCRATGFLGGDPSTTIRSATVREAPTVDLQKALKNTKTRRRPCAGSHRAARISRPDTKQHWPRRSMLSARSKE